MEIKRVGVALLGLGVVGGGTYEILRNKRDMILKNDGVDIEVKYVLEKNPDRLREHKIDECLVASDMQEILNDPDVKIIAEFFGGVEPAKSYLIQALLAGKSIVTANKEMISKSWSELEQATEIGGGGIYFEASCVGGVPVIRTITDSLQGNQITSIKGIVNGTTNYILSRMSDEEVNFNECLKDAQRLGYAEADPTADIEGFDATYKSCILSSLAYKMLVPLDKIYREGIADIKVEDIKIGKELGYTVKLLAISKLKEGGKLDVRVHPAFVENTHPLAFVKDSFNALFIHGDSVDNVMLYGRGAGAYPTGSAIVSDIVYAAKCTQHRRYAYMIDKGFADVTKDFSTQYYLRFKVKTDCGTLEKIARVMRKNNVSVKRVLQKSETEIVFVTYEVNEDVIRKTICEAEQLSGVEEFAALIRIE